MCLLILYTHTNDSNCFADKHKKHILIQGLYGNPYQHWNGTYTIKWHENDPYWVHKEKPINIWQVKYRWMIGDNWYFPAHPNSDAIVSPIENDDLFKVKSWFCSDRTFGQDAFKYESFDKEVKFDIKALTTPEGTYMIIYSYS